MPKLMMRRHKFVQSQLARALDDLEARLSELLDWPIPVFCSDHDAHKALCWALAPLVPGDKEVSLSNLCIVTESLRNAYATLLDFVPKLLEDLVWDEAGFDEQEVYTFWKLLGVHDDVAEVASKLNICYRDGKLHANKKFEFEEGASDLIKDTILAIWEFVKFTESRWLTVGLSCRHMVAADCVGLTRCCALIFASDCKTWYINGFKRWDNDLRLTLNINININIVILIY